MKVPTQTNKKELTVFLLVAFGGTLFDGVFRWPSPSVQALTPAALPMPR